LFLLARQFGQMLAISGGVAYPRPFTRRRIRLPLDNDENAC